MVETYDELTSGSELFSKPPLLGISLVSWVQTDKQYNHLGN